jgi:hypothetical protein
MASPAERTHSAGLRGRLPGTDRFSDRSVFFVGDVRTPGVAEGENTRRIGGWLWGSKVAHYKTPNVLSERNAKLRRSFPSLYLKFSIETDVDSCRHTINIIRSHCCREKDIKLLLNT